MVSSGLRARIMIHAQEFEEDIMAALDSLQKLPGFDPERLAPLPATDQQKLLDALHAARKAQDHDYQVAFDKALSHVPALLRGTIRKIIAG